MPYSLILDVLFVGLLAVALVYMARLNRRLDSLRAGREEFEALLKRFATATEQAQANVGAMKTAAESTGKGLQEEIDRARGLREDLAFLADRANSLADRLELAITRSRPAAASGPAPSPAPSQPPRAMPSNVARMPIRGEEPRGTVVPGAPRQGTFQQGTFQQGTLQQGGPAASPAAPAQPPLSSGENELLRRLSTLR